jgi:hypothetical protein
VIVDSLWAIVEKETGKILAGYKTQSAYTSEGQAKAALKAKKYGAERFEVIELVPKEATA